MKFSENSKLKTDLKFSSKTSLEPKAERAGKFPPSPVSTGMSTGVSTALSTGVSTQGVGPAGLGAPGLVLAESRAMF